jgi:hypothetical protein
VEQNIIDHYRQQAQTAQAEITKNEKLANKYSLQRLIVFGVLILSIYLSIVNDEIGIFAFCLAVAVAWFSWLVSQQNKYDALKQYYSGLKRVVENEIESIQKHTGMYYNGDAYTNEKHFYTADLDIFGPGSLFHLTNRAATTPGNDKLATWLNAAADVPTILARQEAVQELIAKPDWKQDFQTKLLFCLKQPADQVQKLTAYLKIAIEIKGEKLLWTYSYIAPFLVLLFIVLSVFYPWARYALGVLLAVNYRLVAMKSKEVEKADLIAGKIGSSLSLYALAFECIENAEWQTPYTSQLAAKLNGSNEKAVSAQIKELGKLVHKLNYRLNWLMDIVMSILLVWNVRQVIAIENWKRRNHENLEAAFGVIAEFEAIISLASLKINYPEWHFPQIADGAAYTLSAKNIGHPLLYIHNRVTNDYELSNARHIDIITGSNMAGKSTFLRTIGINTVLALCGGPVCAGEMQVSVVTIISYMRIKDSLNESTSTFKAELDRLQMLLGAVETQPKVFFLIDEMLRGTNSVDKYLGSKAVIEQLIAKKAVGMVATHDLQIAELEKKYPDYIRNFYFDIQVKNGEMLFDYKIKHGECKTFNASLLLKQIGIDVDAMK